MNEHAADAVRAAAFAATIAVAAHSVATCHAASKQRAQEGERTLQRCIERFSPKECNCMQRPYLDGCSK